MFFVVIVLIAVVVFAVFFLASLSKHETPRIEKHRQYQEMQRQAFGEASPRPGDSKQTNSHPR